MAEKHFDILKNTLKEMQVLFKKIEMNNIDSKELNRFLIEKLNGFNKETYAKIVLMYMEELVNYCDLESLEWIVEPVLVKLPEYPETLYRCVINYKKPNDIYELFGVLESAIMFNPDIENLFNSKRFIDDIINLKLDSNVYCDLLNVLNCEMQIYFIDRSIEEKISLDRYINISWTNESKKYAQGHYMDFVKYTNNCFALRDFCTPIQQEELNKYFIEHSEVVFNTIRNGIVNFLTRKHKFDVNSNMLDVVEMVLKEIIESDKTPVSDIKCTNGCFSYVIITNTKVIKVCKKRATEVFPDNPYIINPLIRRDISCGDTIGFIEVTERVKELEIGEINKEDLYKMYKNLRDLDLIWTDTKEDNLGRLTKENTIHWNKNIAHVSSNLCLEEKKDNKVLQPGDLVILDADFIYEANDPKIQYPNHTYAHEFENRYQEESRKIK